MKKDFDTLLIFTSHQSTIHKHTTKLRNLSKSSNNNEQERKNEVKYRNQLKKIMSYLRNSRLITKSLIYAICINSN